MGASFFGGGGVPDHMSVMQWLYGFRDASRDRYVKGTEFYVRAQHDNCEMAVNL
jgi:hypothetical protein